MSLVQGNNNATYLDHGNIAAINGATALSIAFWAWGGAAVSISDIAKGTLHFFDMGGTREYQIREAGIWTLITAENTVPVEDWRHFGMVYDGTQPATSRITIYMDAISRPLTGINTTLPQGSDAATTAPTSLPSSASAVQVGNSNVSGVIGHLRFWTAALTQAEIAQEQHRYWAFRQTNLVLDAPYDDQLAARDYSGNGNHGSWSSLLSPVIQRQGPPVSYGGKVLVTG